MYCDTCNRNVGLCDVVRCANVFCSVKNNKRQRKSKQSSDHQPKAVIAVDEAVENNVDLESCLCDAVVDVEPCATVVQTEEDIKDSSDDGGVVVDQQQPNVAVAVAEQNLPKFENKSKMFGRRR